MLNRLPSVAEIEDHSSPIKRFYRLCKDGRLREAMQAVDCIIKQDTPVPVEIFMCLLQGCMRKKNLIVGRQVHAVISRNECWSNSKLGCQLIRMFASCGSIMEALHVFNTLPEKNFYTWTAIISAHTQHGLGEQALILYNEMQLSCVDLSPYTVVAVLKACASIGALDQGKLTHSDVIKQELGSDLFVGSALVDMYGKCGSIDDAHHVFNSLAERDVVVWSAMAAGYAQHGHALEALQLYEKMQQEGIDANEVTFVSILKSCAGLKALDYGKLIHAKIIKRSINANLIIGNVLVDMYAKCGSLKDACKVFDGLPTRDAVSWNAIIAGCFDLEDFEKAMHLFVRMQEEGIEPNKATVLCLLKSFGGAGDLNQVKLIHACIICQQGELDKFVENTLVDVYAKCGSVRDARKLFNRLQIPDVVSWNSIIAGYAECQLGDEAFDLFERMKEEGREPDKVTFLSVLKACISVSALVEGKLIHVEIMRQNLESDLFVGSTLVDMYAKCGSVEDARKVFDQLSMRNVVSWNALIAGYAECGLLPETLELFQKMQQEGIEPSVITSLSILRACSILAALEQGRLIHFDVIVQGYEQDITFGNALVDMYVKCGSLEDAHKVLHVMPVQDVVSWSTLVAGYAEHGHGEKAFQLFVTMQGQGIEPNKVTFLCALKACSTIAALEPGKLLHARIMKQGLELDLPIGSTLVDMYAKCNSLCDARNVFDRLPEHSVVCWSALIGGYADNGYCEEALKLYDEMQFEGIEPNRVTCLSVMKACSDLAALHHAKLVHVDIIERGLELSTSIGSTLVDMYAKCGSLENALATFDELRVKDVVSWNAIIGGYADHGHYDIAHCYFENMQREGIRPDGVTFVCLLYACSHGGLVGEGYQYLNSMTEDYGLSRRIRHFVCMIDLLGRSGSLEKAEELVSKLPCEPNTAVFLSLLGSCAKYKDAEIGSRAFDSLSKFDGESSSRYVLMSNIYTADQSWEDACQMGDMVKDDEVVTSAM